jgi:choline dehydrogenase
MKRREFIKVVGVAPMARALPQGPQAASPTRPDHFDYIIVGAGSSGCVLANRLSADRSVRVLLLEAGGSVNDDPAITTPGRWVSLLGSKYDWAYATEPDPATQNRRIAFPRGKVHGGSSAINAMTYIRGHRLCFDRWRDLGNPGWGYEDVLPLFKRVERNESGATEYRGADGPLAVSYCTDPHAAHKAFLAAAWQTGFKADARFDFNEPAPNNIAGYYQKNILDGKRHSAADAFLTPALSRPNLEMRSHSVAARLIVEGRKIVGVEYLRDGRREQARAAREVLLCGGVIDSPKLLMLSGIGPADHLKNHGVAVVADVPGVGQNFQDHLKLSMRWEGRTELPGSTVTAGMFTRSSQAAIGTVPDLQFYVGRGTETPDKFVTITVSLVQPRSRGEIRLRSGDVSAPPLIRANYLQEQADVNALVRGVHLARWFGESEAYAPLRAGELLPGAAMKSDAELAAFVRRDADTIFHGAGTCKMGPGSDSAAVVDASLRVRGVEGVRVADASIMPEVVNATTHAACVMIGEKAAELLRT